MRVIHSKKAYLFRSAESSHTSLGSHCSTYHHTLRATVTEYEEILINCCSLTWIVRTILAILPVHGGVEFGVAYTLQK